MKTVKQYLNEEDKSHHAHVDSQGVIWGIGKSEEESKQDTIKNIKDHNFGNQEPSPEVLNNLNHFTMSHKAYKMVDKHGYHSSQLKLKYNDNHISKKFGVYV